MKTPCTHLGNGDLLRCGLNDLLLPLHLNLTRLRGLLHDVDGTYRRCCRGYRCCARQLLVQLLLQVVTRLLRTS